MFRVMQEEARALQVSWSQIVTSKRGQNIKYLPYAFTEYGALMAANVLRGAHGVRALPFSQRACCSDEYDARGRRWIDCIVR